MDSALSVTRVLEIALFVLEKSFVHHQVSGLLTNYNGDIIFELPPTSRVISKGSILEDMDRGKDSILGLAILQYLQTCPRRASTIFARWCVLGRLSVIMISASDTNGMDSTTIVPR